LSLADAVRRWIFVFKLPSLHGLFISGISEGVLGRRAYSFRLWGRGLMITFFTPN
jgi:hypothetical protein